MENYQATIALIKKETKKYYTAVYTPGPNAFWSATPTIGELYLEVCLARADYKRKMVRGTLRFRRVPKNGYLDMNYIDIPLYVFPGATTEKINRTIENAGEHANESIKRIK